MAKRGRSPRQRLTNAERAQILEVIRSGEYARNEIARRFKRSVSTITRIAQQAGEGNAFDRSQTKQATAARKAEMAARRAQLAADLLEDAEKIRAQLWAPAKIHKIHQGEFVEHTIDQPLFSDQKNILISVAIAVDKVEDLERAEGAEEARDALGEWMQAMRSEAEEREL